MTIAVTDNFGFSLLDLGSGRWMSAINGIFIDMDRLLAEARNPVTKGTNAAGKISNPAVVTYQGDVVFKTP